MFSKSTINLTVRFTNWLNDPIIQDLIRFGWFRVPCQNVSGKPYGEERVKEDLSFFFLFIGIYEKHPLGGRCDSIHPLDLYFSSLVKVHFYDPKGRDLYKIHLVQYRDLFTRENKSTYDIGSHEVYFFFILESTHFYKTPYILWLRWMLLHLKGRHNNKNLFHKLDLGEWSWVRNPNGTQFIHFFNPFVEIPLIPDSDCILQPQLNSNPVLISVHVLVPIDDECN